MFGLAFDLDTTIAQRLHPRGPSQANTDIRLTLQPFGFERFQGSTYASAHEDHGRLFLALTALRQLTWFGASLHNLRVFRLEQGTDFTEIMRNRD
jgi:virulence-associated protein VapD